MQRAGIGYDIHPLVAGRPLVLAGVTIPFERGLAGHSDADAACHAIADALLGAAALGDIGGHFSPEDPAYQDVSSLTFLERIAGILRERGWQIGNVDATIVAQKPRLSPYIEEMRRNVSRSLGIGTGQVSIKAKSANGLGPEGRGEGVSAQAVALIERVTP